MNYRATIAAATALGGLLSSAQARADEATTLSAPAAAPVTVTAPAPAPDAVKVERPYTGVATGFLIGTAATLAGGTLTFLEANRHGAESDRLSDRGSFTASKQALDEQAKWLWLSVALYGTSLASAITGGILFSIKRFPKQASVALVPTFGGAGVVGRF